MWSCNAPTVSPNVRGATDEEEDLDVAELISKGEVAWLNKEDAPPSTTAGAPQPAVAPPQQARSPKAPATAPALPQLTRSGRPDRHKRKVIFGVC